MAAHVVYIALIPVLPTGVAKPSNEMTIGERMIATAEPRILPDTAITNSANYPTIKAYIEAESLSGYSVKSVTQNMIVTNN